MSIFRVTLLPSACILLMRSLGRLAAGTGIFALSTAQHGIFQAITRLFGPRVIGRTLE
jgi:hypothetical protein